MERKPKKVRWKRPVQKILWDFKYLCWDEPNYLDAKVEKMKPSQVCTHIAMSEMRRTTKDELIKLLKNESVILPDEGTYPIHEAAMVDRDLIDFLVSRGADVDVKNSRGNTPLEIAIANKQVGNVAALLKHGAIVETLDRIGNNPILTAVLTGGPEFKIAELLLKSGANPDVPNMNGVTARGAAHEHNFSIIEKM